MKQFHSFKNILMDDVQHHQFLYWVKVLWISLYEAENDKLLRQGDSPFIFLFTIWFVQVPEKYFTKLCSSCSLTKFCGIHFIKCRMLKADIATLILICINNCSYELFSQNIFASLTRVLNIALVTQACEYVWMCLMPEYAEYAWLCENMHECA